MAKGFLFNDNGKNDSSDVGYMIIEKRIVAYKNARNDVNDLQKDDIVFLYRENGNNGGIIAAAKVLSEAKEGSDIGGRKLKSRKVEFLTPIVIQEKRKGFITLSREKIKEITGKD